MMDNETTDCNREGFARIDGKLHGIFRAIEKLTASVSLLEQQMSLERKEIRPIDGELVRLEHEIARANARLNHIESRLDALNAPFLSHDRINP